MTTLKFSKAFVQRVIRGELGTGTWTDNETRLGLKRTPSGSTSYRTVLKVGGKAKTFTPRDPHGKPLQNSAAILTLDQARQWAREVVANTTLGNAPVPEKKPSSPKFSTLAETYLEQYRSYRDDHGTGHTEKAIKSETYAVDLACQCLGALAVNTIESTTIDSMVKGLESAAKRRLAFGAAKRVLDVGVAQGAIVFNPAAGMKAPKPPRARHRYPNLSELAAIWQACEQTLGVGADIVQFAIAMPLRVGTIASLTWGEVDLDIKELRLREGDGRKFGEEQRLPLPSLAVELLRARKPKDPKPDSLVFGSDSKQNPGGRFSGWSAAVARIRKRSGVNGWSIHDFRRSMVSIVAEMRPDVSESHLDRLLTHTASSTNSGVKAIYQRASGYTGMRLAVDAWDTLLQRSLAFNVASLQEARNG